MKKSRTIIIAVLLVATLCVGIGYAAFTSRMAISGEAILQGVSESKVVFTDAAKTAGDENVTISYEGANSKTLSLDVIGFNAAGQSATITATISNPHPFEVTLTTPAIKFVETAGTQVDTSDYFKVELVGDAPTSVAAATGGTPATTTLTFKVTSLVSDLHPDAKTVNFLISFMAEAGTT